MRKPHLSLDAIETILSLLCQGLRYTDIAEFAGISFSNVGKIARHYEMGRGQGYGKHLPHYNPETKKGRTKDKKKRSPYHPQMLQKAIELREKGHTLAEIGKELGRSRQAVSVLLRRHPIH